MLLAVPAIMLAAASSVFALRSAIFCLAISSTCALVIFATLSLFGFALPLSMPHAFLMRTGAGGRFEHERERTVLIDRHDHGNDESRLVLRLGVEFLREARYIDAVRSERGTYRGPGVALPAGSCNLTTAVTFLAILVSSMCVVPSSRLEKFARLPLIQAERRSAYMLILPPPLRARSRSF